MIEPTECPHCKASMQGAPIPDDQRGYYRADTTHFSRLISVEIRGVYDGGLFYQCPDCGGTFHRWPEGHPRRDLADRYMGPT